MKNIGLLLLTLLSFNVAAHHLSIEHAYVKETIPGTQVTSAYMVINNDSDRQVRLIKVSSQLSDRIELHQHIFADNMMKMQQVEAITIDAYGSTTLQPHGYHVMIFKPKQPVKHGQQIKLRLYFDDGSTASLHAPVVGLASKKSS